MATQGPARPTLWPPLGDFAAQLLAEREVIPRAQVIAETAAERLPGAAVTLYLYDEDEVPPWSVKAAVGELSVRASATGRSTLSLVAKRRQRLLFVGAKLAREHYAHLDVRRTVVSLAYLPILLDELLLGAIELVSFERPLEPGDLDTVGELAEVSALALASALTYENERNTNLDSITRLTQLYDLERVFNSTLNMEKLLPIIPAKLRELLEVQAAHLWMIQDEDLLLMNSSGSDDTVQEGTVLHSGQGIAGALADSGKPALIIDPADPRLKERNAGGPRTPVLGLMAVPIIDSNALVGVLEVINRRDGAAFSDDDVFFLSTIAETAATALHNASLFEAERKIEILETLVEVSQEITSTLNLDRVLQVVVNGPQRIMRYDRGALALDQRGRLHLKAISGKTEIVDAEPQVKRIKEMLDWVALFSEPVYVTAHGGRVQADNEDVRAKFHEYFKASGMRGWYSAVLADDQGRLGVLAFESANPDFLTDAHLEFLKVVTSQATVALRNASLYTEVPFIGVLEPLIQKKQQFLRMEKRRRGAAIALAVAVVLFMIFVPLPMRVDGTALVAPQRSAQIQAELEGVIRAVHVREGDPVKKGTILAEMDDWDARSALASAQAKRDAALSEMNRALASNDGSLAGMKRVEAEYWASEVTRASQRVEHTRLRSPIDGLVATPHVEDLVGRKLDVGDTFAEVVDNTHTSIDVAIDQSDVPLLKAGEKASLKLESFPTRKFRGQVTVVSPTSTAEADKRVFFARVDVPNDDGVIRVGMEGRGKVSVGWKPAGYVLFRGVGMWFWAKLWSWFGW